MSVEIGVSAKCLNLAMTVLPHGVELGQVLQRWPLSQAESRATSWDTSPVNTRQLSGRGGVNSHQYEERRYLAFHLRLIRVFRPAPTWIL